MKAIAIISLSIISLITMSFNSTDTKKYFKLNKKYNLESSNNFIGIKNTIIIGTSATAFPGNLFTVIYSNNKILSENKLENILKKYNN